MVANYNISIEKTLLYGCVPSHRGDHDGDYTLSTVNYQSEGEGDETVILDNAVDDTGV